MAPGRWLGCAMAALAAQPAASAAVAEAASRPVGGAAVPAAAGQRRKMHRSKDGSTFVFDEASRSWRLASAADCAAEGAPAAIVEAAAAPPLALEWSQFGVTFNGDFTINGRPLIFESGSRRSTQEQLHGDTGHTIWDGAVAMSKLLEFNSSLVRGKRVLELGAGRGVVGLTAASLGAAHTVMTDLGYCLQALQAAMDRNAELLGEAATSVEVCELDWFSPATFLSARPRAERFDVLLAADVVWLLELTEALADALAQLAAASPGAQVLVVHQTRSTRVEDAFLAAMAARHFRLTWTLRGRQDPTSVAAEAVPRSADSVDWHPNFRPDARICLWSFRLPTVPD